MDLFEKQFPRSYDFAGIERMVFPESILSEL
jgi:hypothetical protein